MNELTTKLHEEASEMMCIIQATEQRIGNLAQFRSHIVEVSSHTCFVFNGMAA